VRSLFDYVDHEGKPHTTSLETGFSHEADLRIGGIAKEFEYTEPDFKRFQHALGASLAGAVFGQHPEAVSVTVRLEEYYPPSMVEYRQGKRASWNPIYEAKFEPTNEQVTADSRGERR
jgi:hypothetical protein